MSSATTPVHSLLEAVRQSAGLTSAAIYDTAQALRFQPGSADRAAIIGWILDKQDADGGWGTATMPVARLVPTLASLLALRDAAPTARTTQAIQAADHFLADLSAAWPEGIPDDLPVGMELLLPVLLEEIPHGSGITLDPAPFKPIVEVGRRRREKLLQIGVKPGTPPLHSYEALAIPADANLLDAEGSLSHSPAATAAWLQRAGSSASGLTDRARAQDYLARSVGGTPTQIPGIYPGLWPIDRFEQCFVLYFFAIAGAFTMPAYRDQLGACAADLARAMRPTGIGLSDHFVVDGDDTAAAIIALSSADLPVRQDWLNHFKAGARYYAFPGERHGSLSLIARAMYAAMLLGNDVAETAAYLRSQQQPDGRWLNDKWHTSWIYVTMHALIALARYGDTCSVERANQAILRAQRADGGWGTAEETAYALLGLAYVHKASPSQRQIQAIFAGQSWLREKQSPPADIPPLWIGKELYTLPRVVQAAQQAALIAADALIQREEVKVQC